MLAVALALAGCGGGHSGDTDGSGMSTGLTAVDPGGDAHVIGKPGSAKYAYADIRQVMLTPTDASLHVVFVMSAPATHSGGRRTRYEIDMPLPVHPGWGRAQVTVGRKGASGTWEIQSQQRRYRGSLHPKSFRLGGSTISFDVPLAGISRYADRWYGDVWVYDPTVYPAFGVEDYAPEPSVDSVGLDYDLSDRSHCVLALLHGRHNP